ncbi:hypothetical protein F383_36270 [Gossypium arboreum]|uniref:Uncharacterized protein n=1 Tax=Gossypium arboreum TaxID=29729 RepID=A0A0B0Q200_GOSAR|nr:hypothetical protein F383_36270 [Gossypium arboreum]
MGQKQRKWAKVQNQHGLDLLTRADHTAVSIWQAQTQPKVIAHGCVTRACPCRAQVESNSEKATFEGS